VRKILYNRRLDIGKSRENGTIKINFCSFSLSTSVSEGKHFVGIECWIYRRQVNKPDGKAIFSFNCKNEIIKRDNLGRKFDQKKIIHFLIFPSPSIARGRNSQLIFQFLWFLRSKFQFCVFFNKWKFDFSLTLVTIKTGKIDN
jgi:hypothetical protein